MLNKEDAISSAAYYSKNGKNCGRIYHFKCSTQDCDNILKVRSGGLKKHSGRCLPCSRRGKPFLALYNILKRTARQRNISCTISYDDFLFLTQIGSCCYCEAPIVWEPYTGRGTCRYNLDRKDSSLGYSFDNVVVCCAECNSMKRDFMDGDEFQAVRFFLKRWRGATDLQRKELMLVLVSMDSEIKFILQEEAT